MEAFIFMFRKSLSMIFLSFQMLMLTSVFISSKCTVSKDSSGICPLFVSDGTNLTGDFEPYCLCFDGDQ